MSRKPDPTSDPAADHPSVAKVAAALAEAGQADSARGIRFLPDAARTAAQAAEALGVPVGAIANSLVFRMTADDGTVAPLLVLTSGAHRADTATLAALTGARHVDRADPDFVRAHTGHVIGGVAPVGHPSRITTLVDEALSAHDTVWAAAGHPHTVFPTTFTGLMTATGGRAATVASGSGAPSATDSGKAAPR
ncbi:YbaK/EbsC family protein [Saccharomonospora xinjiangensis]|uniref:YbaK/EbsC family protein n=1 Tax=Saccharomonospora xinjiangensis TaxID=75294 RepID=UPI00350FCE3F